MTSEAPPQTDPGGTQPAAVVRPDRLRQVVPVLLSTLLTLLVLAPVAYVVNRKLPPSLATVDLQALVDEEQKRTLDVIGKGGELSDERSLLPGDAGERAHAFKMHRRDVGDDGEVGADDGGGDTEFAGHTHARLDDGKTMKPRFDA